MPNSNATRCSAWNHLARTDDFHQVWGLRKMHRAPMVWDRPHGHEDRPVRASRRTVSLGPRHPSAAGRDGRLAIIAPLAHNTRTNKPQRVCIALTRCPPSRCASTFRDRAVGSLSLESAMCVGPAGMTVPRGSARWRWMCAAASLASACYTGTVSLPILRDRSSFGAIPCLRSLLF
jgi:hypothetical protein